MNKHPFESFLFCPKCGAHFQVNNEKSKKCQACGFEYYFNVSAAVVAFIFNPNDELLVCKRAKEPYKGTYDLPGGFVDMDETSEQAIKREVFEELNLSVNFLTYLFSKPNVYPYSGFEVHTLDMFYKCTVSDFSEMKAQDDVDEYVFLKLDDIKLEAFGLDSIRNGVGFLKENGGKWPTVDI